VQRETRHPRVYAVIPLSASTPRPKGRVTAIGHREQSYAATRGRHFVVLALKAIEAEDVHVISNDSFVRSGQLQYQRPIRTKRVSRPAICISHCRQPHAASSSSTNRKSRWVLNLTIICSVSKLYFSSEACWSMMNRSECAPLSRRVMMKPKLNCDDRPAHGFEVACRG